MSIRIDDLPTSRTVGVRPECCRDPENLVRERPAPDKIVNTCRVCGRKHYRVLIRADDLTAGKGVDP